MPRPASSARAKPVHREPDDGLSRQRLRDIATLFAEVERHAGARLRALPGLAAMREGRTAWPAGADLDDLLALVLHEVELLVRYVDSRADA